MRVPRLQASDQLEHLLGVQLLGRGRGGRQGAGDDRVGAHLGTHQPVCLAGPAPNVIDRPVADAPEQPLGSQTTGHVIRARHARKGLEHLLDDVLGLHLVSRDAQGDGNRTVSIAPIQRANARRFPLCGGIEQ